MHLKLFLSRYWKSTIWIIIMAYLLFSPSKDLPRMSFLNFKNSDKLIHLFLFMSLEYFLLLERQDAFGKLGLKSIIIVSLLVIVYGGFSEIIQLLLVKSRTGSWLDFLADFVGVVFAYSIFHLHSRITNRSTHLNA
jgi:hypothetical protein